MKRSPRLNIEMVKNYMFTSSTNVFAYVEKIDNRRHIVQTRKRDSDLEDFPVGALVETPSGRLGTVMGYRGHASKRDHFQRIVIRYEGSNDRDIALLQPNLLKRRDKNPEST